MDSQFHRSSSYDSFYMQAQGRPNLKVLEMSPVERVILEETGETVKATGVVYTDYASGQPLNATANKEVIVSAGVFKTPQLLMLSVCNLFSLLRNPTNHVSRELVLAKRLLWLVSRSTSPTRTLDRSKNTTVRTLTIMLTQLQPARSCLLQCYC